MLATGFGIVESNGRDSLAVRFGAIRARRSEALPQRLHRIDQELEKLVARFQPDAIAIEQIFQALNVKTAMQLSNVRGIVLLAAARAGLPVSEYSALAVKNSVVGYGRAEKHQVQQMVQRLLRLPALPEPADAADALAVALCHIHNEAGRRRLARHT